MESTARQADKKGVSLPHDFGILKFVEHRVQEISALTKAIVDPEKNVLIFQRLPRHMRRRVMGHNAKRMPRSVQEAHIKQLQKSGFPPVSKRPSRRYRRRPRNLLADYNRRQKTFVWLETHIWHAKRFHMTEKWGYKLALHPNDKSVRASYRAAAQHCLLHDMSYLVCIELQGKEEKLLENLTHYCSESCGRTFAAVSFLGGQYEGEVMMYHKDTYPYEAIGKVNFMWKPRSSDKLRTLWIWSHPSFYQELTTEFLSVFNLTLSEEKVELAVGEGIEAKKLESRIPVPVFKNGESGVVMTVLKDALCRFKLTGPLSHAVLQQAFVPPSELRVPQVEDTGAAEGSMDIDEIFSALVPTTSPRPASNLLTRSGAAGSWSEQYYANQERVDEARSQADLWCSLGGVTAPSQLPPHCVMALTLMDPRLNLPNKRTKAVPVAAELPPLAKLPASSSRSPVWDRVVRSRVTAEKQVDADINARRSGNLVPGVCEQEEAPTDGTWLPVLMIQTPGSQDKNVKKLGLGCGWDVIVPAGWGMPVWRSLVLRGARPGGLRELESLGTECLEPVPPLNAPDSRAGSEEQELRTQCDLDTFFKKSPSKRANFMKLGIATPFGTSWLQLIKEWSSNDTENFYLLRDRLKLTSLRQVIKSGSQYTHNDPESLVMVSVVLEKGGALDPWAHICLPETSNDLTSPPTEPHHPDVYENERKEMREKHQKALKRLRRQRVKRYKKGEEIVEDDAQKLAREHEEKMRQLVLPSPTNLKDSCSRKLAGFVTEGKFCFSEARSAGVGFMAEVAVRELLTTKSWNPNMWILVRNKTTMQYRVAVLTIL